MATSRTPFICAPCAAKSLRSSSSRQTTRAFTTTAQNQQLPSQDLPRWQQTPPRMKAPFRLRPVPKQPEWRVNDSQEEVDAAYDRFFGRVGEAAKEQTDVQGTKGRDLLPAEVKWLALTHKSHDHGRQGFNDRLANLGKRLVDLQTSLALFNAPSGISTHPLADRNIFSHPALENVDNISRFSRSQILSVSRMAKLAQSYRLDKVVRWKPKKSDNLVGSGVDTVLAHTVYSIVGAVALQRGGEVAQRLVRERILGPLGLR